MSSTRTISAGALSSPESRAREVERARGTTTRQGPLHVPSANPSQCAVGIIQYFGDHQSWNEWERGDRNVERGGECRDDGK